MKKVPTEEEMFEAIKKNKIFYKDAINLDMVKTILEDFVENEHEKEYLYTNLHRYSMILNWILKYHYHEKIRVLDLGTGPGFLAILIKELFDYHVVAADIRLSAHVRKRLLNKGIEVKTAAEIKPDKSLPFEDSSFDLVMFCDVFEHIIDHPKHVFSEIHRILKVRGLMIMTTPNIAHIYNRITLLRGKNPQLFLWGLRHGEQDPRGHFREYSMDELTYLLKDLFTLKEAKFVHFTSKLGIVGEKWKLKLLFIPYSFLCTLKPSFRSSLLIVGEKK